MFTVLHAVICVAGICLFRYTFKNTFIDLVEVGRKEAELKRTMIIGAGRACEIVLDELHRSDAENRNSYSFMPVCIIDDDVNLTGNEIKFNNPEVRGFIKGKVCMVTGGGSIGSELVRQISKYEPEQVVIVDIYENNAYDIQQELKR